MTTQLNTSRAFSIGLLQPFLTPPVLPQEEAARFSNLYAPEHLIVNTEDAEEWLPLLDNAGSVFLGPYTPESVGDYASGTNHVLPT
jgi:histidinol dehydrogenase